MAENLVKVRDEINLKFIWHAYHLCTWHYLFKRQWSVYNFEDCLTKFKAWYQWWVYILLILQKKPMHWKRECFKWSALVNNRTEMCLRYYIFYDTFYLSESCSWREDSTRCFPGTCADGLAANCQCAANFSGTHCEKSKWIYIAQNGKFRYSIIIFLNTGSNIF